MISTTGRSPDWAAPTAMPQIAASLIGVLRTRSTPNSSARPAVAPQGPPSATSSPSTNTRGSARMASASVALIASRYVVSGIYEPGGELGVRERARPGVVDGLLDLRARVLLEPLVAERPLQSEDWVELLPLLGRERLSIELRVALVVAAEPVGEAFEEERTFVRARLGEEASECLVHPEHVVAVHGLALDPPGRDHLAHPLDVCVRRARGELGEAVVLADEDRGQPPEGCQVDRLDEDAALDGPVAEEHDRDRLAAGEARGERAPQRKRDVAADDAGRAEEAVTCIDDVHRAAHAPAEAVVASHQLRHQLVERRALRDR